MGTSNLYWILTGPSFAVKFIGNYLGESSWDSRRQDRAGPGSSRPRTGRRAGPLVSPPGTWDTEQRDGRRRGQGEGRGKGRGRGRKDGERGEK
jgi:hypothetical protein